MKNKAKAGDIGMGIATFAKIAIGKRMIESEMYSLGVMHGQQKMRKKIWKKLDHLISELKNDY